MEKLNWLRVLEVHDEKIIAKYQIYVKYKN